MQPGEYVIAIMSLMGFEVRFVATNQLPAELACCLVVDLISN